MRDRSLQALYGVDPPHLRRIDPLRYLRLSRALAADLVNDLIADCAARRRSGLALVPSLCDVLLANGTGLVDVCGRPKSGWHAMRATCRPMQVLLARDAAGQVRLDLLNETTAPRAVSVRVCWIGNGERVHAEVEYMLRLGARQSLVLTPQPRHGGLPEAGGIVLATLSDARSGELLSEAAHLPDRRAGALPQAGLQAQVQQVAGQWWLEISAARSRAGCISRTKCSSRRGTGSILRPARVPVSAFCMKPDRHLIPICHPLASCGRSTRTIPSTTRASCTALAAVRPATRTKAWCRACPLSGRPTNG
ncbi:hypothetical protein AWV80_00355 [Cupriavidus sp. UYMU48A]|nr:hypothetical protein AWV80_00355 [Cupriavidus sp. UYMU48A]